MARVIVTASAHIALRVVDSALLVRSVATTPIGRQKLVKEMKMICNVFICP